MSIFSISLPADIESEAARLARDEGLSTEQWLTALAMDRVRAALQARAFFESRKRGADWSAFDAVFGVARAGGEPPAPGDEREGD